jgi:hypothetical protein
VEFASPISGASENPKELTGAEAQKSPQADAYLAWVQAVPKGLDALTPLMTPQRIAEMKQAVEQMGADKFGKAIQQEAASKPKGDALRKTITSVLVDGNRALLRAKLKGGSEVVPMTLLGGAWKLGE